MIAGLRWRVTASIVGGVVWLSFVLSYVAFWARTYSDLVGIAIELVSLLILSGFLVATWAMPASLERNRSKVLAMRGILPALFGLVIWILGTVEAAYQRAVAASCGTGQCSQTAGSDAVFEADVWTIVSYIGIGISVVGFATIVVAFLLRERAIVGSR